MTGEPSEEAIANFVSFTSTSREQAISFLKANDLNSHKAINAYFENPTSVQPETQNDWETFHNAAAYPYGNQSVPTFNIEDTDPVLNNGYTAPPSRPPSRMNTGDSPSAQKYERMDLSGPDASGNADQNLTPAQREERDLQQAVAMSLGQDFGPQESGVTTTNNPHFARATRDHYDENTWAMTVFNPSAREVIISPDPEDRRRIDDEPAFLRPSQEFQYLAGFLTIIHSIPLAREALLLRGRVLSDYGYDPQWWNGQPIKAPKVMSLEDAYAEDSDWDDILYEAQRLMAFLDSTERAFGSTDALASVRSMSGYDSDGGVSNFLEAWQEAAVRATPGDQLSMIFSSHALKRPLSELDTPIEKEFFILDPNVESEHGQTLYDVLDRAVWADRPGEELDDVWLEHVAEILTIRLESSDPSAKSIDVKIPAVFYPDRYLDACREISRDFRLRRLDVYSEISKLENVMNRLSVSKPVASKQLTSKEVLEKAAAAAHLALPKYLANGMGDVSLSPEVASAEGQRLAHELRAISDKIDARLKELEDQRQKALETLRSYSKTLTEPSASEDEPPKCKYTLRGVCTAPHVTYVLRRSGSKKPEDTMEERNERGDDWQWWRISFSTDDARTKEASRTGSRRRYDIPPNADVAGFTCRKVREIEVLRAAREESNNVLLVYANSNAVNFKEGAAPPPLQEFVNADNRAFQAELEEAERVPRAEHLDGSSQPGEVNNSNPSYLGEQQARMSGDRGSQPFYEKVNVFDYEVSSFDEDSSNRGQEMQESGGGELLGQ
ncbi:hypothetical protein VTN77DRAFT_2876 [Rasamsonia byssochlamydoides]|uniref:uncharacterized protein n=1 Tax=Rasamsonia byssochlamydoides TaxID=89139 RepID=UPI003744ABB1